MKSYLVAVRTGSGTYVIKRNSKGNIILEWGKKDATLVSSREEAATLMIDYFGQYPKTSVVVFAIVPVPVREQYDWAAVVLTDLWK